MRHIGVYVKNLELMKKFYCDNFHMTEEIHSTEHSQYIDIILGGKNLYVELYKLKTRDDGLIELLKIKPENYEKRAQKEVYDLGQMHIALTVENIYEIYNTLKAQGIEFISEPYLSADGYAKVCFCKDPEGNYIELVQVE